MKFTRSLVQALLPLLLTATSLTTTLAGPAAAADFSVAGLELNDLWVRASVPGQTTGAGYLHINNSSATADRLLWAESDAATRTELHQVITEDGVAKMRQVAGIDIPAHGSAKLSPGGFHVMFLQLTGPFKQGSIVPVVLKFKNAGEIRVNFTVKPSTYNPGSQSMPGHGADMKH
jgi:copper(I)-binding protein